MHVIGFLYGVFCYLVFLGSFLYAIGFVGNLWVPKSIDSGAAGSLAAALLVDGLLLGLFAIQHSIMARPWFKERWTRIVPRSVERSTYVLLSSLVLIVLYHFWIPLPDPVWQVSGEVPRLVLTALFWLGWLVVLSSTFMINHFDLFGLRQVYLALRRQPYTEVPFRTTALYRVVRHPIMLGFLIAFWATPDMSAGHLLFAVATTGYVLLALVFEERDLQAALGEPYTEYRRRVPMILPWRTPPG